MRLHVKLAQLRQQHGYSLRDLAPLCDISISSLSRYEQPDPNIEIHSLYALARAYGMSLVDLLRNVEPYNISPDEACPMCGSTEFVNRCDVCGHRIDFDDFRAEAGHEKA